MNVNPVVKRTDNDVEQVMITKLQEMCGRQFTSKWVGMTKDMLMCQDTKTALSDYINLKKGSAKIELLGPLHGMEWNILALTRG